MKKNKLFLICIITCIMLSGCTFGKNQELELKEEIIKQYDSVLEEIIVNTYGDNIIISNINPIIAESSGGSVGKTHSTNVFTGDIIATLNVDNKQFSILYKTKNNELYSNEVCLNMEDEFLKIVKENCDINVYETKIYFFLKDADSICYLPITNDYSFHNIYDIDNLIRFNVSSELMVLTFYEGDSNEIIKLKPILQEIYENNSNNYQIQIAFVNTTKSDIEKIDNIHLSMWSYYLLSYQGDILTNSNIQISEKFPLSEIKNIQFFDNLYKRNKNELFDYYELSF